MPYTAFSTRIFGAVSATEAKTLPFHVRETAGSAGPGPRRKTTKTDSLGPSVSDTRVTPSRSTERAACSTRPVSGHQSSGRFPATRKAQEARTSRAPGLATK